MISPIILGVTPIIVAPVDKKRASLRFQNTGATVIYIKKIPFKGAFTLPSLTDYEVLLYPSVLPAEAGDAFITNSISAFAAVSSAVAGVLSVYETKKV